MLISSAHCAMTLAHHTKLTIWIVKYVEKPLQNKCPFHRFILTWVPCSLLKHRGLWSLACVIVFLSSLATPDY